MKTQLFFCGFLPGVTAAFLTTQPSLAASLPIDGLERGLDSTSGKESGTNWQLLAASKKLPDQDWSQRLRLGVEQEENLSNSSTPNSSTLIFGSPVSELFTANNITANNTVKPKVNQKRTNDVLINTLRKINVQSLDGRIIQNPIQGDIQDKKTELNKIEPNRTQVGTSKKYDRAEPTNPIANLIAEKISQTQISQTQISQTRVSKPISVAEIRQNNITSSAAQLIKPRGENREDRCQSPAPGQISKAGATRKQSQNQKACENTLMSNQQLLAQNTNQRQTPPVTPTNPPVNPAGGGTRTNPLSPQRYKANPNPLLFPTKPDEVKVQESRVISLSEALEIARRNNTDLQAALLQLEGTKASLREAQASLLPTVNLNSTITRSQSASGQRQNESTPEFFRQEGTDSPNTVFNSDVQLNYSLYTSGLRRARIRQAEEEVRSSELTVEQRSEEVRLNVTTQYYNLQEADQSVRIATSAVRNAQKSLEDAQALERAGVGTRFDVLRSQVNRANAEQQLTNSLATQQVERRRFAFLLNLPQSVTLRSVEEVKIAALWNRSLEETIILAFQNRPELQQQLSQREINEQRRRQALSQLGPQVSLIANYELLDLFNDGVPITDGYSVAVRASLNLFDGGSARAQAAQARANIAIAETNFTAQRNQVRFDVEQFYAQLESNLRNVSTATTALEQAQEALRLARLRFQAGVGTQTDVINSENDLTNAEGNRINAILDYNRALANLERAVTLRAR